MSTDYKNANFIESKSYHGLFRGMKVYNWGLVPSVSNPSFKIGMMNLLQDISLGLSASKNKNEGNAWAYDAKLKIARYYPVFALVANQSARKADSYSSAGTIVKQNFNETTLGTEISVPLKWLRGNFITQFEPNVGLYYRQLSNIKVENTTKPNTNFGVVQPSIHFSSKRRTAYQNIGTRFGVQLDINYFKSLNSSSSEKMKGIAKIFLPGLGKNHNLTLTAAYQNEKLTNLYQYADIFEYSRGYSAPVNDKFKIWKVEYGLPLLYPDFGIAGITYFKRIKANLFYDYGVGKITKTNNSTIYNSAGAEIIFDNTMLNVMPISIGLRQSFLLTDDPLNTNKKSVFNVFLSTSL